jgi:hypothetical protein
MAYKNKTYVCFDADNDIHYYRLMCAWKQNDGMPFNFYNAHDINFARDASLETSIKRQLRDRLLNTKVFVVLVGEQTRYLFRFVRWEMEAAIALDLPIISVNINGLRKRDDVRCPPIIRDRLAIHIPFSPKIMQYALEHWPATAQEYKRAGKTGPYFYTDTTYRQLGY